MRSFEFPSPLSRLVGGMFPSPYGIIQRADIGTAAGSTSSSGTQGIVAVGASGCESLMFALDWRSSALKPVPPMHAIDRPSWRDATQTAWRGTAMPLLSQTFVSECALSS